MSQSMNPASVAKQINTIPQWHFYGEDDKVVPKLIGESYARKAGLSDCSNIQVISDVSHDRGWEIHWPRLLKETSLGTIKEMCDKRLR